MEKLRLVLEKSTESYEILKTKVVEAFKKLATKAIQMYIGWRFKK